MPAHRKADPRVKAAKDRQFELLLRRASNSLKMRQPPSLVRVIQKKRSTAA